MNWNDTQIRIKNVLCEKYAISHDLDYPTTLMLTRTAA